MIKDVPILIEVFFGLTVLMTIIWFYISSRSKIFLYFIIAWTVLQSLLALNGTYQDTQTMPPKVMILGVLPTIVMIIVLFSTASGRKFIDGVDLKSLIYFHSIRIPVEIILSLLFHQGLVSIYMTFEGTNFDLFSGITAPLVAYIAFRKKANKKLLLAWNIICFLLLLNVVITAIFALPSPWQKLSFNQPNIAVVYFPFSLLPTVVVPLVLFAHLIAFRRLRQ